MARLGGSSLPTKVVRVIARLNVGGPALHCTLLSESLAKYGFDTTLVAGVPPLGEANYQDLFEKSPQGYRYIQLGKLSRRPSPWKDFQVFVSLVKLLRKERPKIVHTHTAKAGVLGRLAAFVTGVPVVVHTFHGHVLQGYFNPLISKLVCWVERLLAFRTKAIVTLSPGLRTELASKFGVAQPKKFRVIPLGRDLSAFKKMPRFQGGLRKGLNLPHANAHLLGTVGRLVPIKDQALLLKACAKLSDPWHLVLVGEGDLKSELESLAKQLEIQSQVTFLGWRSDLPNLYSDFDLFVLTSKNEGTPLSIIEAFAAGCPVVSTDVGGVSDMFTRLKSDENFERRQEGALFKSGDVEALTQVLKALLGQPHLLSEMSKRARTRADHYSDEALSERTAKLYQELLAMPV